MTTTQHYPTRTAGEAAEILLVVARASTPKLVLPTIAVNHGLSMAELHPFLEANGYPDKTRLIEAARRITNNPGAAQPDAPAPPPAGEAYITALPAGHLFADAAYQRELDEARVSRMAKAYDPALVGILEVSERRAKSDGQITGYAILDGQHRWALAKDVHFGSDAPTAEPHLACRVHIGLTVDEEAKLYHRLNTTRKQLTGWDRWKARRSSGDPVVVAIEATATAAGFTISYRGARGQIKATSALEHVHRIGQTPLLTEVLGVTRGAWRDDPEAVTSGILQGLGHVLTHYNRDELDVDRLVEALTGIVPRQLNARAAAVREIQKGTIDKLTAHVIVEQYNQLRRSGQIESFFTRVRPQTANKGTQRAADLEHVKAVRAWALDAGLMVPSDTYVPKSVHTAYDDAHTTDETTQE